MAVIMICQNCLHGLSKRSSKPAQSLKKAKLSKFGFFVSLRWALWYDRATLFFMEQKNEPDADQRAVFIV